MNWTESARIAFEGLLTDVMTFIPTLIGAILVLIVGIIIASVIGSLFGKIVTVFKLDDLIRKLGMEKYFDRAGMSLDTGWFVDRVVFWFFILVTLLAVTDILNFYALSSFLQDVLSYIPNVIAAALIILAAVVLANFLEKIVRGSILSARLHAAKFLGALTWYVVIIFGFIQALYQLLPPENLYIISTVVTGLIAMIAIAGGIAFGLGGRDYAAHLLSKFRDKIEE